MENSSESSTKVKNLFFIKVIIWIYKIQFPTIFLRSLFFVLINNIRLISTSAIAMASSKELSMRI